MANDPNNPTPSLQDIINLSNVSPAPAQSANVPPIPMANPEVPQPPTLTNTPLAPALAGPSSPQSLAGPQALAPSAPSESQAQSNAAATPSNNKAAPALPPTAPGSATGLGAPPPPPQSFMDKMKGAAGAVGQGVLGATGLGAFAPGANATPMQKGQAIMSLLGKIGSAGVMATGSPQQREQAIQQQGQQNQLRQMQNEAAYRQGMLGNTAQANAIKAATEQGKFGTAAPGLIGTEQQKQQIAQLKANSAMQTKGYLPDEQNPGAFRPMTPDEILKDPTLSQNQEVKNAAIAAKQASAAHTQAQTNALMNPNSQTQKNFEAKLAEQERVALAQLEVAKSRNASFLQRTQLPIIDAQGNTHGYFNPQTNSYTPLSGNPAAAAAAGGEGGVMPPKPTQSMVTMGQVSRTIQDQVPTIKAEVDQLADKIGPGAGRWNDFWVKKGGVNDPAYAGLDQDLQLYATALGRAHFGARIPEGFVRDMTKDFGMAQSPADLQSRIDHAEGWVNGYASRIGGAASKTSASKPLATSSVNGPQEGATATGPGGHKIAFTGGKWIDAATKQPIQ